MDILLTFILSFICMVIGCFLGWCTEKKANRNPGKIDGYIAIDHNNGEFNLFAGFNREPRDHLHDRQIVRMEVVDISEQAVNNKLSIGFYESQEKQST